MILLRQKLYSKKEKEKEKNRKSPEEKIGRDIGTAAGIGHRWNRCGWWCNYRNC